jgi:GGDEF domain-containing protein
MPVWYWHCFPLQGVSATQAVSFVVPALLLSLAAGLAVAGTLPDWLVDTVNAAPFVVFGSGAAVGILIRRGRLVLGLTALGLADLALAMLSSRAVFDAVALLLPLNLAVIVWLREFNVVTRPGATQLGAIVAQASLVATLHHPELAALIEPLERPLVAINLDAWTALPQLVLVAYVVALGFAVTRFLVGRRPLAAGTAWALIASFLAFDGASAGRPAEIHLVTAGLLLILGALLEPSRAAYVDDTTGLPGRLALNLALRRLPKSYALASVEIDEFRAFREAHGSEAAKRMLRLVAEKLMKVGGGGRAFYCEGHMFALIFRRMTSDAAARHLEVVRRAVEVATVDVKVPERSRPDNRPGRPNRPTNGGSVDWTLAVTISAGIAEPEKRGADPHEVLRTANQTLDHAKQAGLNCVSVAPRQHVEKRWNPLEKFL